jgi:putative transcriptional regulator
MIDDAFSDRIAEYALGALDEAERLAVEAHLRECADCGSELLAFQRAASSLPRALSPAAPQPAVREQLLDLAEAPALPVDLGGPWEEPAPGIRRRLWREDPARNMRAYLVWAAASVKHPSHRHAGDESILVLRGGLSDERGFYGPGDICHSRKGSIHSETIPDDEDCLCYVVYYGELEYV